jgi:hypothetical protein
MANINLFNPTQNFDYLKSYYLSQYALFVDNYFPANDQSLNLSVESDESAQRSDEPIYWKRPHEISDNPQFIVDGIEPNDIVQGSLGNCWLISSMATLVSFPEFCQWVIPHDQSFNAGYYAGIFHFKFWRLGEWYDVVIDDLLPVDSNDELIFCHNEKEPDEFFAPLLEKAYAKFVGSYGLLDGGDANIAMVDLTGAICEYFDIRKCVQITDATEYDEYDEDEDENEGEDEDEYEDETSYHLVTDLKTFWDYLMRSYKMKSLMNVSLNSEAHSEDLNEDNQLNNGLIPDHAYSVIQIVKFKNNNETTRLIKLRNPHGATKPWKGAWSAHSKKWNNLDEDIKDELNLDLNPNGEFYMSFADFTRYFDELAIAHVDPNAFFDSKSNNNQAKKWHLSQLYGVWVPYVSAGFSDNNFWANSQYVVHVQETQKKTKEPDTSLIVALSQGKKAFGQLLKISFSIYSVKMSSNEIKSNIASLKKFRNDQLSLHETAGNYESIRDFGKRFYLKSGYYVIIPCVEEENASAKYLIRIFHDSKCDSILKLD